MDCRKVQEVVFLFTDNEMEEELLISFKEHIDLCPPCARRIDAKRKLLKLVRKRCIRAAAPEGLREKILIAFPHRRGRL